MLGKRSWKGSRCRIRWRDEEWVMRIGRRSWSVSPIWRSTSTRCTACVTFSSQLLIMETRRTPGMKWRRSSPFVTKRLVTAFWRRLTVLSSGYRIGKRKTFWRNMTCALSQSQIRPNERRSKSSWATIVSVVSRFPSIIWSWRRLRMISSSMELPSRQSHLRRSARK